MTAKQNFWNNWDFKTILQIILIVVGFIVSYTKLDAKVTSDKREVDIEVANMKDDIKEIKNMQIEILRRLK